MHKNYLILAITTHEFAVACDAENNPETVEEELNKSIASKLKRSKLSKNKIKPIVINAFYHKDGKEMVTRWQRAGKEQAKSQQRAGKELSKSQE